MGYSARYHAASLVAVFLALAAGILIGAEFGGDVVSSTRANLEQALQESLEDTREEVTDLSAEVERSDEFASRVYPVLVGGRLAGDRVAVIAFGEPADSIVNEVEEAVEPAGGEVVASGVVHVPPRTEAIEARMAESRSNFPGGEKAAWIEEVATSLGAAVAGGSGVFQDLRADVFSRVSGSFERVDGVVVVRGPPPDDLEAEEAALASALEDGLIRGLRSSEAPVVGVEDSDSEDSSLQFFDARGVTVVNNVDEISGHLALVLALDGAQGIFGHGEGVDGLLPDVITDERKRLPQADEG